MKKYVLVAIVALLSFGSVSAQQNRERRRPTVEERVEQLKKDLKLTDEQTKKVTALYTDFEKKIKEAGEGAREKMREERQKLNASIEAVLNDEQKATFKARQERRGNGQRGQQQKRK